MTLKVRIHASSRVAQLYATDLDFRAAVKDVRLRYVNSGADMHVFAGWFRNESTPSFALKLQRIIHSARDFRSNAGVVPILCALNIDVPRRLRQGDTWHTETWVSFTTFSPNSRDHLAKLAVGLDRLYSLPASGVGRVTMRAGSLHGRYASYRESTSQLIAQTNGLSFPGSRIRSWLATEVVLDHWEQSPSESRLLYGDLVPENLGVVERGVAFVDLGSLRAGHPLADLAGFSLAAPISSVRQLLASVDAFRETVGCDIELRFHRARTMLAVLANPRLTRRNCRVRRVHAAAIKFARQLERGNTNDSSD